MDFAALMEEEIANLAGGSGAKDNKAQSLAPAATNGGGKKFISRREAEEARKAAYLAEQKALEEERTARAAAKRRREEEAAEESKAREEKRRRLAEESQRRREERAAEEERARRKRLGLPELPPGGSKEGTPASDEEGEDGGKAVGNLSEEELAARLRGLGEPVVLFAEDHAARLKRLRKLTAKAVTMHDGPIPTTLAPVEEKDMKISDTVPKVEDKSGRKWLYRQLTSYFNMVLQEWEIALAKEGNRDTSAGRAAINAMVSSKETMKPVCLVFSPSPPHHYWNGRNKQILFFVASFLSLPMPC